MSKTRAREVLIQSVKTGRFEFDKVFSIDMKASEVRIKGENLSIRSKTALEKVRERVAKSVLKFANSQDIKRPEDMDVLCAELDRVIEATNQRFVWAYSHYNCYNASEKWQEFINWINDFRNNVRSRVLVAIDEQEEVDESSPEKNEGSLLNASFDPSTVTSQTLVSVIKEQGFNGGVAAGLQHLLLALSVGELTDAKMALQDFLAEVSRQAKQPVQTKYDARKRELADLRNTLKALEDTKPVLPEELTEEVGKLREDNDDLIAQLEISKNEVLRLQSLLEKSKKLLDSLDRENKENELLASKVVMSEMEIKRLGKELVKAGEEKAKLETALVGSRETLLTIKGQMGKLREQAESTTEINRELQRDLNTLQITANRRMRMIIDLQGRLVAEETKLSGLLEAFQKVRKTTRSRKVAMKPCTLAYIQSGNVNVASCDVSVDERAYVDSNGGEADDEPVSGEIVRNG